MGFRFKFFSIIFLGLMSCSDTSDSTASNYPDISSFNTNRSDQFIVELNANIVDGHMYRGESASTPHNGAHINFINNSGGTHFPNSTAPSDYPSIYAVADGTITAIQPYYEVISSNGTHYRYGLSLAFANQDGETITLEYSIEPMVDPGDSQFYENFILVDVGDQVKKGAKLATMYLSTDSTIGTDHHIHFSLKKNNSFLSPSIFTPAIMTAFSQKISTANGGQHNYDGGKGTGNWMSDCMGYKIAITENPYQNTAESCLK
ncbi:MAG: hypothetical protein VW397_02985 [Candidatus Margulisiibacteriota bacterium]